jgi:hypothetical protein
MMVLDGYFHPHLVLLGSMRVYCLTALGFETH